MGRPQGYALITGASSGIGAEFGRQLAARGWSLILVARSAERLKALRAEWVAVHPGIDVRIVPMDLSAPGAPLSLFQKTQAESLDVTLLINNAGFGAFGEFATHDRERLRQMIDLNIGALVELAHLYLGPMMQRRSGSLVQIASVAGFAPLPYSSVYAATKAFVRSFSEALAEEARGYGVHVLVVNPGVTETKFFDVAGQSPLSGGARMQTAQEVVTEALKALDGRQTSVVTGRLNRMLVGIMNLTPRRWITLVVGKKMRQGISQT